MAAVRLRVIFRTVITDSRPLTLHNIPVAPRSPSAAGAVALALVNQSGDRLPRDQSPVIQGVAGRPWHGSTGRVR
jgi:hypothetical protein